MKPLLSPWTEPPQEAAKRTFFWLCLVAGIDPVEATNMIKKVRK
jgi:hypothetical protein